MDRLPDHSDIPASFDEAMTWFREESGIYDPGSGEFAVGCFDTDCMTFRVEYDGAVYTFRDQPPPKEWKQDNIDRQEKERSNARLAARLYPDRSGYEKRAPDELIEEITGG